MRDVNAVNADTQGTELRLICRDDDAVQRVLVRVRCVHWLLRRVGSLTLTPPPENAPSAAARRRGLERALVPSCPGKKVCRTRRGSHKNLFHNQLDKAGDYDAYECVDVQRDLEACGGCPGVDGVDCTSLEGVNDVACVRGECEVRSCERGYRLEGGECV